MNIFVSDDDVRYLDGLNTKVPAGETVSIIPAVAGGCCPPPGVKTSVYLWRPLRHNQTQISGCALRGEGLDLLEQLGAGLRAEHGLGRTVGAVVPDGKDATHHVLVLHHRVGR